MILKHLIELQSSEALLFHKNLSDYIHSVAQLIFRTDLHTMNVKKLAMYGMYKIVTTTIYNQGQILVQSWARFKMKFRLFEP